MNNIYISYSHNDVCALNIAHALEVSVAENYNLINSNKSIIDYNKNIETQIMDSINKCDFFIFIFDNYNPNIMFELGYAMGKNKNIILIGEPRDIPYSLKNLDYIRRSENINKILPELYERIQLSDISPKEIIHYDRYKENILRADREQEFWDNISYIDFEKIIYEYLKAQNVSIKYKQKKNDNIYDFMLPSFNCVVEVKKYNKNSKISLSKISEFISKMTEINADRGIIISNSGFTQSATNFIEDLDGKIILLSLEDLLKIDGKFESIFAN